MVSSTDPPICHKCGALLSRGEGAFYIVNIEAYADPSPPNFNADQSLDELAADYETTLAELGDLSEQEMMDQVYRKLRITLCTRCYTPWIEAPVGD